MDRLTSDLAHDLEVATIGVTCQNEQKYGVNIRHTTIGNNRSCQLSLRRAGNYHAIDDALSYDEKTLCNALSSILEGYLKDKNRVLVVGFGNANYTCDKLGTSTLRLINTSDRLMSLLPRVKAVTGISSLRYVQAIVREIIPDIVLAIDTLSTSRLERLATCIQITDAGMSPGSGVSNSQGYITRDSIGVDVVAMGVPLVIGTHCLIDNNVSQIDYLVPSQIDEIVRRYSRIFSSAINMQNY